MAKLIFVDCEAVGPCPGLGQLTEFGAVDYASRRTFHGVLFESEPSKENPAVPVITGAAFDPLPVFYEFERWLERMGPGRPVLWSDNPAYDFPWISHGFWSTLGRNPFGHSARRISDYYAGVVGDVRRTQDWKRWRNTPHDHNPVNDALGNAEAFEVIQSLQANGATT